MNLRSGSSEQRRRVGVAVGALVAYGLVALWAWAQPEASDFCGDGDSKLFVLGLVVVAVSTLALVDLTRVLRLPWWLQALIGLAGAVAAAGVAMYILFMATFAACFEF